MRLEGYSSSAFIRGLSVRTVEWFGSTDTIQQLGIVPGKRVKMTPKHLAYHEAGHAVAGFVLGFPLGEITTRSVEDGHAMVMNPLRAWKRGDGPRREIARRYAIVQYAGAASGKLLPEGAAPWYDDYDKARVWLRRYAAPSAARVARGKAPRRQEEALRGRALEFVRRYSPAIARLAKILLERERIAGHETEALLRSLVVGSDECQAREKWERQQ